MQERGDAKMQEKERITHIIEELEKLYPQDLCSLQYPIPHELLISVRLSAQCTDARVNLITPALFEKYPTENEMSEADVKDVEALIHSCGFFRAKANDIVEMSKMLKDVYGGVLPDTVEELIKLPGVGRKTANLICGDVYGKPAVVADTHLIRISNLLGLVSTRDPKRTELELKKLLPPEESTAFCHRVVTHGRKVCIARRPQCAVCCLKGCCKEFEKDGAKLKND